MAHRGAYRGWSSLCLVASLAACGAADEPIEPGELALRDLLGVAPRVAVAWDDGQRAAAREVLAGGLVAQEAEPLPAVTGGADHAAVVGALLEVDDRRFDRDRDALGLTLVEGAAVDGARAAQAIDAPLAMAALLGEAAVAPPLLELDPQAWPCPTAPSCQLDVLAALAADAAPGAAQVRVLPAVQLPVIAALLDGADGVPTLLVNPIVTAVGERPVAEASGGGGSPSAGTVAVTAAARQAPPLVTGWWDYGGSMFGCTSRVESECATCRNGGACEPVWSGVSGADACSMLEASGENYHLLCINLAVSLADIGACLGRQAPGCTFDATAIESPAELQANRRFIDDATCEAAMDACLSELYGADADGGGCGGCDCGGCDDDCSDSNDQDCSIGPDCEGQSCGGDGCNDGQGCNNSSGSGNCSVARTPAGNPGRSAGLLWALLPVPAALLARRRARRRTTAALAAPAAATVEPPTADEPPVADEPAPRT